MSATNGGPGHVLPSTVEFIQRMQLTQPNYPSEDHQRLFVRRYDRWQQLEPCAESHEHGAKCYSERTLKRVYEEIK